jgi:asparagine synthase (glutamine-hydrolysing)
MCGIAGLLDFQRTTKEMPQILGHMCDSLAHRGPDDHGIYTDPPIGLGIRRLSIIDVSGGHQPITNEERNLWIVLNGEIYNYAQLRHQLQDQGHRFSSASDTEVVLHQYEQDGPSCLDHFNGMFALAIWDQKTQSLFMARDRLGIKPLYYYWNGHQFLFASELKALFASGLVPKELDLTAVWDYLTPRYVPQPKTIWRNIYKLLPGHTLTLSRKYPTPITRRYWQIRYSPVAVLKAFEEYTQEFTALFLDAVRVHLISDVPVGILLSGGLDSSAVAAAIKEVHPSGLDSFSVAFEASAHTDELPYARKVAQWIGTNHHEIIISLKEFKDFLPRYVYYMDEPLADLASVPLYYVSRMAGCHVKVVMSGEGSDETLAGYDFDRVVRNLDRTTAFQSLPPWIRSMVVHGSSLLGPKISRRFRQFNTPLTKRWFDDPPTMTNIFDSGDKKALFQKNFSANDTLDRFRDHYRDVSSQEPLHQILHLYCQQWLVDDLLTKADRMTMANSLELRVPFLDFRLVEWLSRTPPWVKVGRNAAGNYETKRVLREFSKSRLPQEIISRPKQGFPVPVYGWLRGPLKAWATDLLNSTDTRLTGLLSADEVQRLAFLGCRHRSTLKDQQRLWQLLIFELWLREWLP